jgi:Zn-dependent protease with chaperone function
MSTVYLALAAAIAASGLLRPTARRLAPQAAAIVLASGALIAGVIWVLGLGLIAAATLGRSGVVARAGHWSAAVIAAREPVPLAAGVGSLVALSAGTAMFLVAGGRLASELKRLRRLRALVADRRCGDVAVIDGASPEALALPGWWQGSILLTSAMLRALDPAEQRVLLAHERSHLRNAHWVFRLATRASAAALPTLRPVVRDCDLALERWADESAAEAVGDRHLTAAAVARAALATRETQHALTPGFTDGAVAQRVEALLDSPRPSRWGSTALPGGLLLVALTAVLVASRRFEDLFELARHL